MGNSFNPDAYIAANAGGGFNPDAYLAAHAPAPSAVPSLFHRALDYAAKEGAPIAGGVVGGMMGAPLGPAGVIGGAALGGAAGRGLQRDWEYTTGQRDPANDTPLGNATDIARSGLAQGASSGVGLATGAAVDAVAPKAAKLGSQLLRVANGTPEKYGAAALGDAAMIGRAPAASGVSKAYTDFEAKNGLTGLQGMMEKNWQDKSVAELKEMALGTARKISAGQPVTNQELYLASQSGRMVRDMAAAGNPEAIAAVNGKLVGKAKSLADATLEKALPEYQALRQNAFEGKVRQAFSSVMPQNKNLSANALRGVGGLSAASYEAKKGNYGTAAGILGAMSPAAAGLAIRAGGAVAPAIGPAAMLATRAGAQDLADSLTPAAAPSPAAPVVQSPGLISNILKSNVLNPAKSGTYGAEIKGLNLPSSMVSGSGKTSITQLARLLHEAGAISENDEGEAVQYLKSVSGKMK